MLALVFFCSATPPKFIWLILIDARYEKFIASDSISLCICYANTTTFAFSSYYGCVRTCLLPDELTRGKIALLRADLQARWDWLGRSMNDMLRIALVFSCVEFGLLLMFVPRDEVRSVVIGRRCLCLFYVSVGLASPNQELRCGPLHFNLAVVHSL